MNALFRCPEEPLELTPVTLPEEIPERCVLVKVEAATICGSDLHTYRGRRQEPTPLVLGHEGVGRVVVSKRAEIPVGARVTWSIADSCMQCRFCTELNMPQKCCVSLLKYGHSREPLTGCYASHILLRAGTEVLPVLESLPAAVVAPVNCAIATVFAALEPVLLTTAEPADCSKVLVQGAGLLGVYATLVLKRKLHVETVFVRDTVRRRLDTVAKFGAVPVYAEDPLPCPDACDLVLELCGVSDVLTEGVRALRVGGTYVWVGMVTPESRLPITGEQVVRKCLTIRGVHNYAPRHLKQAVDFLSELPVDVVDLLATELAASETFNLADVEKAFQCALTDRRQAVSEQATALNPEMFDDVKLWTSMKSRMNKLNAVKVEYFRKHLQPGSLVLDVGCGAGYQTELLARENFTVVGVDISVPAVAFAEERFILNGRFHAEQVKCLVGSAYELPFPDASFDAVVLSDTVEHLHNLPRAVEEISRVLRDDAVVVLDTFNRSPFSFVVNFLLLQKLLHFIPRDAHDWHLFTTPAELVDLFGDYGFSSDLSAWRGISVKSRGWLPILLGGGTGEDPEFVLTDDLTGSYIGYFIRGFEK